MFGPSKFVPRVHAGSRRWYQWEDPGERMRVDITLDTVDEIRAAVEAASADLPERGEEIGGILFGHRGDPVVIQGFEPLECEHRRGPSFTLSAKERKALRKRLEKTRSGLDVVGFYRSHTRTGLYLDQEDFSLMQELFSDPSQVALLVKPWAGHGQIAGFFFWEDGDIYRRATHLQFPFESSELEKSAPMVQEEELLAAQITSDPVEAVPPRTAALPPDLPPELAAPAWTSLHSVAGILNRPQIRGAAMVASGVLGVVALGISAVTLLPGRKEVPPVRSTQSGNDIGLSVVKSGGGFHVTWNQRSLTLARAGGATLRIDEGGAERIVPLDEHQIRTGNITYYPGSDTVNIRLEPGQQQPTSGAAVTQPAVAVVPVPVAPQAIPAKPASARKPKPAPKPFMTETLIARRPEGADRVQLDAPPAITPGLQPETAPVLIPERRLPQVSSAHVSYEALRPKGLSKVVSKIPGLRLLQKRQYREAENFQPAKPIRRAAPAIPAGVPAKGLAVELKIGIDEFGGVERAEVVSKGSDGHLEDLALQSVQSWRFAPARLGEESVPSEMLLRFDFDPARKADVAISR